MIRLNQLTKKIQQKQHQHQFLEMKKKQKNQTKLINQTKPKTKIERYQRITQLKKVTMFGTSLNADCKK